MLQLHEGPLIPYGLFLWKERQNLKPFFVHHTEWPVVCISLVVSSSLFPLTCQHCQPSRSPKPFPSSSTIHIVCLQASPLTWPLVKPQRLRQGTDLGVSHQTCGVSAVWDHRTKFSIIHFTSKFLKPVVCVSQAQCGFEIKLQTGCYWQQGQ